MEFFENYHFDFTANRQSPETCLKRLRLHLRKFDNIKHELLKGSFKYQYLEDLRLQLEEPIDCHALDDLAGAPTLKDPAKLKRWMYMVLGPDYLIDIRYRNNFPCYLLVKVRWDYPVDSMYITDSLYASPDYPFTDTRLVSLRIWRKDKDVVRLDQFCNVEEWTGADIKLLGRILTATWREKEDFLIYYLRPAGSPFRQLAELCALVKNTNGTALRDIASESTIFFEDSSCYPQPAIKYWLKLLTVAEEAEINQLEKKIRRTFYRIHWAWQDDLLNLPVRLSTRHPAQPIWKWWQANHYRLETWGIVKAVGGSANVQKKLEELDVMAQKHLDDILMG